MFQGYSLTYGVSETLGEPGTTLPEEGISLQTPFNVKDPFRLVVLRDTQRKTTSNTVAVTTTTEVRRRQSRRVLTLTQTPPDLP